MFGLLFGSSNDLETFVDKLHEVYSLLSVAKPNQMVVIEIEDKSKSSKLHIAIESNMFKTASNPALELREFHNILLENIQTGKTITISIE